MMEWIKSWIAQVGGKIVLEYVWELVINLILKRLEKYGDDINWSKVRDDCIALIRKNVPTYLLEEVCIAVLDVILKHVQRVWETVTTCEIIEEALRNRDFRKAIKLIKNELKWRLSI